MSRQKNEIEAEPTRVSLTPGMLAYLSDLVQTGLFGRTVNSAAERLIELGIKNEINAGTIARRPNLQRADLTAPDLADIPPTKRAG